MMANMDTCQHIVTVTIVLMFYCMSTDSGQPGLTIDLKDITLNFNGPNATKYVFDNYCL